MPTSLLQVGQLFGSFKDLKDAIDDCAIADKFEFRSHSKDSTRADYHCRTTTARSLLGSQGVVCSWRVFGTKTREGDVKISRLSCVHNCIGVAARPTLSVQNTQAWLCRAIPNHLIVTRKTTSQEVIDTIRLHHQVVVNYAAAHLALSTLANSAIDQERECYQMLPAYVQALQVANPRVYAHLEIIPRLENNNENNENLVIPRFNRVFISPFEARLSFQFCRKFIAVDGTFCKARFIQTLLSAVTIDANGHVLLLAWAIVKKFMDVLYEPPQASDSRSHERHDY